MAQGRIFLLDGNAGLTPLEEAPYDSEALLQGLLADHPDLLAGDQIDQSEPRRWLLVRREKGVASAIAGGDRWAVDHLFLDQDGIPTLVEVKRSSDTRIRREVVGQILEYAANAAVYWTADSLRAALEERCRIGNLSSAELLTSDLGYEGDADSFWEQVGENLRLGRIRLILASDQISPELQRIVEFLNGQMERAEVLALEIRQFVGPDRRTPDRQTLVPRVLGRTMAAAARKTAPPRRSAPWTMETFRERVRDSTHPEDAAVVELLLEWAKAHAVELAGGTGTMYASLYFRLQKGERSPRPFYLEEGDQRVRLHFSYSEMGSGFGPGEPNRLELCRRMSQLPGGGLDPARSFPGIPLTLLVDETNRRAVLSAMEWVLDRMGRQVSGESREIVEMTGLDLDADAVADLEEARRDREAGNDEAYTDLQSSDISTTPTTAE